MGRVFNILIFDYSRKLTTKYGRISYFVFYVLFYYFKINKVITDADERTNAKNSSNVIKDVRNAIYY